MFPNPAVSSWCEIHSDRISRNLEIALGLLPEGAQFCAVLKADAYGHGINNVLPLVQAQGVKHVGITTNGEARAVREAGFEGRLIRLRAAMLAEIEDALHLDVEEQVGSLSAAKHLRKLIDLGRYNAGVHLALDANGMSRDGLEISTPIGQSHCHAILEQIQNEIVGICSHFPSNVPEHLSQSTTLFQQQVAWILEHSALERSNLLIHAGSSLTLVSDERTQTDMFRCGAILYGILKPELGFQPTMDLKARVVSIGNYPKGATVGYDRSKVLEEDRCLASISIGYANGFRRNACQSSVILVRDKLCPVVGKVSMNTIVADVTDIADVAVGDHAYIFGGELAQVMDQEMVMGQFETIMADLYSDWGQRNPRYYK